MLKIKNSLKKKKGKSKEDKKSKDSRTKSSGISDTNNVTKSSNSELDQSRGHTKADVNNANGNLAEHQSNKAKSGNASLASPGIKPPNPEMDVRQKDGKNKDNDAGWENIYPSLPKPEHAAATSPAGLSSNKSAPVVEPYLQPSHGKPTTRTDAPDVLSTSLSQMNLDGEVTESQEIGNQPLQNDNEVQGEIPHEGNYGEAEGQSEDNNVSEEQRERLRQEGENEEQRERLRQERENEERERLQQERENEEQRERLRQERENEERERLQQERENEEQRERLRQERENEEQRDRQQDREQNVHTPVEEEAQESQAEPLVSSLLENDTHTKLVETLCLMLLPLHSIIKNWENLAYELGAPAEIRTQLKRHTNHSQTRELFDTLSMLKKDLKIQELIDVLTSLRRKDVVQLLKSKIPEDQRNRCVTEAVLSDDELMEKLETMLDKESKVVKNWYYVGLKLGLSKETLQEVKDGSFRNNVGGFFEYVYSKFPTMTVERFKEIMRNIGRNDVEDILTGVEGPMKTSIPLDSDKMHTLCYLLSKNSCGTVKDWRNLAMELEIGYHEYKIYEKEEQENPTKLLLEWALIEKPEMTVSELCGHFKNISRYDVIEEVEKFYNRSFTESSIQ